MSSDPFLTWARNLAEVETRKRRLECLRYLARTPSYEASAQLLRLDLQRIGVPTTDDDILAALTWLEAQNLITVRDADDPVARLTTTGRDVADGLSAHPGVLRPTP